MLLASASAFAPVAKPAFHTALHSTMEYGKYDEQLWDMTAKLDIYGGKYVDGHSQQRRRGEFSVQPSIFLILLDTIQQPGTPTLPALHPTSTRLRRLKAIVLMLLDFTLAKVVTRTLFARMSTSPK